MLQDPLRYILTKKDGLVKSYDNLPTNILSPAASVYENPFAASTSVVNSVEWDQSNGGGTVHAAVSQSHTGNVTDESNSYLNLSQVVVANPAAEYDDVIVPTEDTFDRVCMLCVCLDD